MLPNVPANLPNIESKLEGELDMGHSCHSQACYVYSLAKPPAERQKSTRTSVFHWERPAATATIFYRAASFPTDAGCVDWPMDMSHVLCRVIFWL